MVEEWSNKVDMELVGSERTPVVQKSKVSGSFLWDDGQLFPCGHNFASSVKDLRRKLQLVFRARWTNSGY